MFPFGIFPFNVMPMFNNPWWPIEAAKAQGEAQNPLPPIMKTYMEAYAAWTEMMIRANPWTANYMRPNDK